MNRKFIIAVPARLESKRLPNKVLKDINGKPLLKRVLERCESKNFDADVVVCTDSEKIKKEVTNWGYKVKLTPKNCNSGSQRISSVIEDIVYELWNINEKIPKELFSEKYLENTYVINVQGDQPFFFSFLLFKIYENFKNNPSYEILTPIYKLKREDIHNPNVVKTLVSNEGKAIYFSRSAIPHVRGVDPMTWHEYYSYWGHVGIYGYKATILSKWNLIPNSKLEQLESLEQLRLIDSGFTINTFITDSYTISVDTKEQLEEARTFAINIEKES